MNLLESIIAKAVGGDLTTISEKEIMIASLFELKSLNEKIDVLEVKIDETAKNSATTAQLLEVKYDKKFTELEIRLKLTEESRQEGLFWKKILNGIPQVAGFILVVIGIASAVYGIFRHFAN